MKSKNNNYFTTNKKITIFLYILKEKKIYKFYN